MFSLLCFVVSIIAVKNKVINTPNEWCKINCQNYQPSHQNSESHSENKIKDFGKQMYYLKQI